jgi:hypothetical protein
MLMEIEALRATPLAAVRPTTIRLAGRGAKRYRDLHA